MYVIAASTRSTVYKKKNVVNVASIDSDFSVYSSILVEKICVFAVFHMPPSLPPVNIPVPFSVFIFVAAEGG